MALKQKKSGATRAKKTKKNNTKNLWITIKHKWMKKKMPFNNTTIIMPKDINILTTRWEKWIKGKKHTHTSMSNHLIVCIEFANKEWNQFNSSTKCCCRFFLLLLLLSCFNEADIFEALTNGHPFCINEEIALRH